MSPEEIVRAEMAAWGRNDVDEVMSYIAENLTLHVGPYAPVSGHDAIRKTMEGYFSGGTCVDLEILYLAAVGDVVLMERIDHWIVNGKTMDIPHMGGLRGERTKKSPPGTSTSPHPVTPKREPPGQRLGRTPLEPT
ncbi:MAG TPA: nuclear transport factor 2 family protein [Mycobacterium sp.]|uniref:nuclear transport factor 2 family protein n=1 Tax=Mycobacterium sp. TaxID=1785 RepID=UPI002C4D74E9|nr:nuclear transport factor 2 family protein [Mycobacterium sp.]HME74262.1 nuclear transport factor 2 family protein [Mycobacterium sp.]